MVGPASEPTGAAALPWSYRHRSGHHRGASGRNPAPSDLWGGGVEPDGCGPSAPLNERPRAVDDGAGQAGWYRGAREPASSPCRHARPPHEEPHSEHARDHPREHPARLPGRPCAPVVPRPRARGARLLGRRRHLRGLRRRPRRRRERRQRVRLLRRPALRQRPAALRPPAHRLRQGRRPALPHDARPPRRAPLRLGHPRPARRGRGRAPARDQAQVRDRGDGRRGLQRRLPRLGAALHRRVACLRHAPGPLGRLRQRLQDARPGLHGKRHVGLQDPVGQGPRVLGLPRALVLLALRDAAVCHRDQDGRRLHGPPGSGRHGRAAPPRLPRERLPRERLPREQGRSGPGRCLRPDLDDDAVDAAVEPGRRGAPGRRVRPGRDGRHHGPTRASGSSSPRPGWAPTPASWETSRACCAG